MCGEVIFCKRPVQLLVLLIATLILNDTHAQDEISASGGTYNKAAKPASLDNSVSRKSHLFSNPDRISVRVESGLAKYPLPGKAATGENAKRFGGLSLVLSTELSIPQNQSSTPGDEVGGVVVQKPDVNGTVNNNKALSELNAQIASLEEAIEAQKIQLGVNSMGKSLPENDLQSKVLASLSVEDNTVGATQDKSISNLSNGNRLVASEKTERNSTDQSSSYIQSGTAEANTLPMTFNTKGRLAIGSLIVLLTAWLGIVWLRRGKTEHIVNHDGYQGAVESDESLGEIQGSGLINPKIIEQKQILKLSDEGPKEKLQPLLPPEYEMLEEADIYLRFGHDKLAEEALREAIKINPKNPQAYLTLLRIYFSREETDSFLELAKQVKSLGDESVWSRVAEMGRNLDSNNLLYH